MSKADRLRSARIRAKHPSASAAARSLGLKVATYVHHENGTREFDEDAADLYARRFHVRKAWLLLGDGDMVDEEKQAEAEIERRQIEEAEAAVDPEMQRYLRESQVQTERDQKLKYLDSMTLVREIGGRATNQMRPTDFGRFVSLDRMVFHPTIARWGIPTNHLKFEMGCTPEKAIAYQQTGDSMLPVLRNGDMVLIDTSIDELLEDGVYLIGDGNLSLVLRSLKRVIGANPPAMDVISYGAPEAVHRVDVEAVHVVGFMRGLIRRV